MEPAQDTPPAGAQAKTVERPINAVDVALYAILVLIWGISFYAIEFQLGTVPVEVSIENKGHGRSVELVVKNGFAYRPADLERSSTR